MTLFLVQDGTCGARWISGLFRTALVAQDDSLFLQDGTCGARWISIFCRTGIVSASDMVQGEHKPLFGCHMLFVCFLVELEALWADHGGIDACLWEIGNLEELFEKNLGSRDKCVNARGIILAARLCFEALEALWGRSGSRTVHMGCIFASVTSLDMPIQLMN